VQPSTVSFFNIARTNDSTRPIKAAKTHNARARMIRTSADASALVVVVSAVLLLLLPSSSSSFSFLGAPSAATTTAAAALFRRLVPPIATSSSSSRLDATTKEASSTAEATESSAPQQPELEEGAKSESKRRLDLLSEAVRSFNSSAAQQLVDELVEMRKKDNETAVAAVLDDLLLEGPDKSRDGNKIVDWVLGGSDSTIRQARRLLARFSKRARMASLRRTLDLTTPPPQSSSDDESSGEDEGDNDDDEEDRQRRRRRALVSLLRQFASNSTVTDVRNPGVAVTYLERKARREARAAYKNEDLTSRRPSELETPEFEVLSKVPSKNYEIRRYKPYSVCSVSVNKPRPTDSYKTDTAISDPKSGSARAFGALAGYLFGKNQEKQAMAMTAPVLMKGSEMSFVLPSDYWGDGTLKQAPKPFRDSGVTLSEQPGEDRAVVMFGGYASKKSAKERERQLLELVADDGEWEAVEDEPVVTLSQYNDPFTPPWKRLNEVSIQVRKRQS